METRLKSEIISDFLNLLNDCKSKHPWARECVGEEDKKTLDLLHQLELGSYKDRSKTATELSTCRKDRRYYKDVVEEAEPLVEWANKNQDAVNYLRRVLGDMRKVENYHADRTYTPRVLNKEG